MVMHCDSELRCVWAALWQNQQNDWALSEDSDQPGHPPGLIRVFTVRMKKDWILSYPLSASEVSDQTGRMHRLIWVFALRIQSFFMRTAKTLIRLGGCPGWSESSLGTQSFCWFCHEGAHFTISAIYLEAVSKQPITLENTTNSLDRYSKGRSRRSKIPSDSRRLKCQRPVL